MSLIPCTECETATNHAYSSATDSAYAELMASPFPLGRL
jgi:hypothetical protein